MALLKSHIRQNHCKKTNEEDYSVFENIGSLTDYHHSKDIPPVLKEIGLGASLYLLTLKAFSKLYLVLLILNLPVLMLYIHSNIDLVQDLNSLQKYSTMVSIGNLGMNTYTCKLFYF
jgi:hypothetical protein